MTSKPVCFFCGKNLGSELPWQCHYCGQYFCVDHRLPEAHACQAVKRSWESYKRESKRRVERVPLRIPRYLSTEKLRVSHGAKRGWNIAKGFSFTIFVIGVILFWISLLAPYSGWNFPDWISGISPKLIMGGILTFGCVILSDFIFWKLRHRRYFIGRLTPRLGKAIFWISISTIFGWGVLEGYGNTTTYLSAILLATYLDYCIFKTLSRITRRLYSDEGLFGMMILAGFLFVGSLYGLLTLWFYSLSLPLFLALNYIPFEGYIPLEGTQVLSVFLFVFLLGLMLVSGFLEFRFMRRAGIIVFPR